MTLEREGEILSRDSIVLHARKPKKEMFANKKIESQPHKAKSTNAHIAFLPTLIKLNKDL